ncbi:MAG TPA: hypothetical protein PKC49_07065 [Phycisphaerae bacterium]|nr:hypothetical protein [Phycisphaerae bacterium]
MTPPDAGIQPLACGAAAPGTYFATRGARPRIPPAAPHEIVVVKVGGSVLSSAGRFGEAAAALRSDLAARPDERLVVVVSAQLGQTDALRATARALCAPPDPAALDLLLSTGELRSVALLALHLRAIGVAAAALGIHASGLFAERCDGAGDVPRLSANPLRVRGLAARHPLLVAPGFVARGPGDHCVTLGRGGSDLTAVAIAAALRARRCELIKDVPGYFTRDPHRFADALPIEALDYDQALRMAAAGCELVQPAALRHARDTRTPLLVRSLSRDGHGTRIDAAGAASGGGNDETGRADNRHP